MGVSMTTPVVQAVALYNPTEHHRLSYAFNSTKVKPKQYITEQKVKSIRICSIHSLSKQSNKSKGSELFKNFQNCKVDSSCPKFGGSFNNQSDNFLDLSQKNSEHSFRSENLEGAILSARDQNLRKEKSVYSNYTSQQKLNAQIKQSDANIFLNNKNNNSKMSCEGQSKFISTSSQELKQRFLYNISVQQAMGSVSKRTKLIPF